jgi:serine-type D-Ala-D-Ala carboxypeptidase (penicillin-binding protein 5/6)
MYKKIVIMVLIVLLAAVPLSVASAVPPSDNQTYEDSSNQSAGLDDSGSPASTTTSTTPGDDTTTSITPGDDTLTSTTPGDDATAATPPSNDPFKFACKAAILLDYDTGTALYERNADEKLPVASVTKVMTLLLSFEALDQGKFGLDDEITISKQAAGMGGSQALLDANAKYKAGELIKTIIVASANDSSVAMAELIAGSETLFVDMMNARAAELGMVNTHFVNCTGLPASGAYTTARDVSIMSRELLKHPMFFQYSKVWMYDLQHSGGRITQLSNTNKLTRFYDGCDGIKTGSTDEAGYCLSATAKRGDSRFIAVIAGATTAVDRNASISKMLDYAFATYKNVTIFEEGSVVQNNVVVWGGQLSSVNAIATDKISILVKKGEDNKVDKIVEIFQPVHAPVERGAQIGIVKVLKGGQQIAEYPLIADRTVAEAGFWTNIVKILDTLK